MGKTDRELLTKQPTSMLAHDQPRDVIITHVPGGRSLKTPVIIPAPLARAETDPATQRYIIESLTKRAPTLIPFTLQNQSLVEVARYYLRHESGSASTLYNCVYAIDRFCRWCGKTPDELIAECLDSTSTPNPLMLHRHALLLDDWVGHLQAQGLSPGYVADLASGVKNLHLRNGAPLNYPYHLSRRVKYKDRAPTPEELQCIIDVADIRERVIVSCLALGGFREGTLAALKYYHVAENLERGVVPIHIHVEAEITKGKYHDYDTFLGREAVDYLKAYLDLRRRGSPRGYLPPEEIHDMSPLIRSHRGTGETRHIKGVTRIQIYQCVHHLYFKAGLIKQRRGLMYKLRPHSIRKYFRTQLTALGVNSDYVEYMMGHTVSAYHDIQMKGVEFLRNIYSAASLSIQPRTRVARIEQLKELVRILGYDPEKVLVKEALVEPHRAYAGPAEREEAQVEILRKAVKEMLRKELLDAKAL